MTLISRTAGARFARRLSKHGALVALVAALGVMPVAASDWTRFGGPNADFSVGAADFARSWGAGGPKELWRIELGEHGHATPLVEGDRVYVYVREGGNDVLAALDADSGKTLWRVSYESLLPEGYNNQFGPGPHSTPLIVGERIFTVSSTHVLKAWNKADGTELWSVAMKDELGSNQMGRGYGASPAAWKNLVLVNGSGEGQGIVAFDQETGDVVWKALDGGGYSSPVVATIDGVPQVLAALGPLRAGLDPDTGAVLWSLELPAEARTTFSTQLVADDNLIFSSSAYADGSRILDVRRDEGEWKAEVLWYTRKLRLMHGSVVRAGNTVLASSGDFGPAFLTGIDIESGELRFRQRGFAKANMVKVGDLFLVLDEDGKLGLLDLKADGFEVLAEREGVLDGVTWAAPVVVGSRAYLRSRTEVVALDLSASS